jgi:copper(I)-binding protein/transcriptional regulator GlxA family with amidase domain
MLRKMVLTSLVTVIALGFFGALTEGIGIHKPVFDDYVCPPCGCGNDDKVHDKPGYCSVCGMQLVSKGSASAQAPSQGPPQNRKKAAILIFDGVQIIDYTGPYEVFGQAGMEVFTVAAKPETITTAMNMKVTPHYTLENAPASDVLLIPGGGVTRTQEDPNVIKWIQERSKQTEYVVSVCNGAYILAKTGLLDGLTATTFYDLLDGLPAIAPKVKVVRDQRYVDNGKFITTAGISSGIDGSLYLVSKLFGKARAQMVALNMEYDWKADSTYARADFADRHIRKVFGRNLRLNVPTGAQARVLSTEGASRNWEVKWEARGETSADELLKLIGDQLNAGRWANQNSANAGGWKFSDEEGGEWRGVVEVRPAGSKVFNISLKVERVGASAAKPPGDAGTAEKFVIQNAWIQEMPPARRLTAAYMTIENLSGKESALLAAKADVAGAVELHRAETNDGMMRMRKLDRVTLPAGKTELTGDLHIMLIDLKSALKEGDQVALTLEFENGVKQTVLAPVKKRSAE